MILLLAKNHQEAHYYCQHVAEPPLNPLNQRQVLILTGTNYEGGRRLRGMRLDPKKDHVVKYGNWTLGWRNLQFEELHYELTVVFGLSSRDALERLIRYVD